jgi:hypothetical protein
MNEVEKISEDIGKAVAYPFVHTAQFIAVLGTAMKDEPEVQAALIALIKSAEAVDVDAVSAIASKGLDLPDDLKAIADVQAFFTQFKSQFLPVVEAAYKQVAAAENAA